MLAKLTGTALAVILALGVAMISVSSSAPALIDVFLSAGQSNSQGMGDGLGPRVPAGVLQAYKHRIGPADDPVGPASTGSAWPSYGITYRALTGRDLCIVPAAHGGSWQVGGGRRAPENWDADGTLWPASAAALDDAMQMLAVSRRPVLRGVLWQQGENDGPIIESREITADQYRAALTGMIARYRQRFGAAMPFYLFLPPPGAGSQIIRDIQESIPLTDPNTHVVFRDSYTFPQRGLMQYGSLHYRQRGYDEMGRVGAVNVVAAQ